LHLQRVLLRLIWLLSRPVRGCWSRSEQKVGKHFLTERVLRPLLPAAPAGFEVERPGGGRVFVHYAEDLGLVSLLSGGFEDCETEWLLAQVSPGATAVDVGANVGMFTIPLASAGAQVLAFEPAPENACRLEENLRRNGLSATVRQAAVADSTGTLVLLRAADPMFHSTTAVAERRATGDEMVVEATTLDTEWRACGSPSVAVIKIDIEGGEATALRGAYELLESCRPRLLLEAANPECLAELEGMLGGFGYRAAQPAGFSPKNYAFTSTAGR
jgi:FkbM family methyltransferase